MLVVRLPALRAARHRTGRGRSLRLVGVAELRRAHEGEQEALQPPELAGRGSTPLATEHRHLGGVVGGASSPTERGALGPGSGAGRGTAERADGGPRGRRQPEARAHGRVAGARAARRLRRDAHGPRGHRPGPARRPPGQHRPPPRRGPRGVGRAGAALRRALPGRAPALAARPARPGAPRAARRRPPAHAGRPGDDRRQRAPRRPRRPRGAVRRGIHGNRAVPLVSGTGARLPLHATGVGKVLLAEAPPDVVDRVLRDLPAVTPYR